MSEELSRLQKLSQAFRNPKVHIPTLAVGTAAIVAGAGRLAFNSWSYAIIIAIAFALVFVLTYLIWSMLAQQRENRLRAGTEGHQALEKQKKEETRQSSLSSLDESFARGLAALKASAKARQLPWYLLIGEPASGKTCAIGEAGLDVPAEVARLVETGATRNCAWWLTNQAVVIDTAGRYVHSDDGVDRKEWRRLLRLIRQEGPKRPLNGVLVTVPVTSLLGKSPKEIEASAHELRRRLNEIVADVRLDVPIYLLITKADLIEGLLETTNALPHARLDEALGWTNPQRMFENAGDQFLRGFEPVIKNLEGVLPELIMREPDPDRRRKIFLFPQELEDAARSISVFLQRTFEATLYGDRPFLRGVYFTSATQTGTTVSPLLERLGHAWAVAPVENPGGKRSLFLHDLFRSILIDPEEAKLAQPTHELAPGARSAVLGLGAVALLTSVVLWGISFTSNYRTTQRLRDNAAPARVPAPRLETLDRLRTSIGNESQAGKSVFRRMGLGGQRQTALNRARHTFVRAFGREYEIPAKTNLISAVGRLDTKAFGALADLALDVVWLGSRGELEQRSQPDIGRFADNRRSEDARETFNRSYNAFVSWAPEDSIERRIEREREVLTHAAPTLLRLDTVENWCKAESSRACPPVRYGDLGLGASESCARDSVLGVYSRNTWENLIFGLAEAVGRAGTAPGATVGRFLERYQRRFEQEWREFLVCTPTQPMADSSLVDSPYVRLLGTISNNTRADELWNGDPPPGWFAVLHETTREEPNEEGEVPPWKRYQQMLNEISIDVEYLESNPEDALDKTKAMAETKSSGFHDGMKLIDELVPLEGDERTRRVSKKLRVILALPLLNGLSAILREAGGVVDRAWYDRIASPFSGDLSYPQLEALYSPHSGALRQFRVDVLNRFYRDGRPRPVMADRTMTFGPTFQAWLSRAEALQQVLFVQTSRSVRFDGVPSRMSGNSNLFVTKRELTLTCPDSVEKFLYQEGMGSHRFKWTPRCNEVALRVWVRALDGRERELQPRQQWTGALAFTRFLQAAQRIRPGQYQWQFSYPNEAITVAVRYGVQGGDDIRTIAHRAPPQSIRD